MTTIIGIDPGLSGGLAYLGQLAVYLKPMPSMTDLFKDLSAFADGDVHVFLEKAQPMPKNGITSMFNYGHHNGMIEGIILSLKLRHTLVAPQTWMKSLHAGTRAGATKARSVEAARRLFPDVELKATPRCKLPHLGITEALLIAEYGRRILNLAERDAS